MSLWRTPSDKFPITFPENCSWRLVQSRLSKSKTKAYYTTDAKVNDHSEEESQEENVKDRESSILRFYAQHRSASQSKLISDEIISSSYQDIILILCFSFFCVIPSLATVLTTTKSKGEEH